MSVITAKLVEEIRSRGIACECIDISPGGWARGFSYHAIRIVRTLTGVCRILGAPLRGKYRYIMHADAGLGLVYNIALALAVRITGRPVTLYHHSTRYVLAPSRLMRLLLAVIGRGAPHVFCSAQMAALFGARYGTAGPVIIVNNAAWVDHAGLVPAAERGGVIRLGFLSNLIAEKGAGRAIETLALARNMGLEVELVMAGACPDSQARAAVQDAEQAFGNAFSYCGMLEGPQKVAFYAALDFFLFPSLYDNETQSLVVPEALAAGTPVIAYNHRFVGEILGDGGKLIGATEPFAQCAVDWIVAQADSSVRDASRQRARSQFEKERDGAEGQIDRLVSWAIGG